jgi:hypothetical protein
MGNKLRFANHSQNSKFMNAYSKNVFSEGSQRICLYALRDILKGEEIRFDYDGNNQMVKRFPWINDKDEDDLKIQQRELKAANRKGKAKKTLAKKNKLDQVNTKKSNSNDSNEDKSLINKKRLRNNEIESNGEINTIEETDSMPAVNELNENFAVQDYREIGEYTSKSNLKLNENIINLLS